MFSFFNTKPMLDEGYIQGLHATFKWSMRNLGEDLFHNHTILIVPSNKLFPGKMDSAEEMARLLFKKVKEYAFVQHWPCLLQDQNTCNTEQKLHLELDGNYRQLDGIEPDNIDEANKLIFTYDPTQMGNPEAIIANFSHAFAHYLGNMVKEPPPGEGENWGQVSELIAIFMGFGIMFSNSAFVFRGGCGSCGQNTVARQSSLTEEQATYALALFSTLKSIENNDVVPFLKPHLKSFYKRSVKDIKQRNVNFG